MATGNPVGRPKKAKRAVGRPKGEASAMKEFRQRLVNSPRSKKVLDSIMSAALDDNHKNQSAAWKIITDRIIPVSSMEKIAGSNTRSSIQINISGVSGVEVDGTEAPLDAEYTEVAPEGEL